MATFKVPVLRVDGIEPIENADAIEVARILGYQCVVRKGELNAGDAVVYIPEASIVPEWLLRKLNLWDDEKGKGRLAGPNGDRVKAVRLRGVISQGLVVPLERRGDNDEAFIGVSKGDDFLIVAAIAPTCGCDDSEFIGNDVSTLLGIEKWEPEIPSGMAGEFFYYGVGKVCPKFDVENFKNFPNVLKDGEEVEFSEKIHGCKIYDTIVDTLENGPMKIGDVVEQRLAVNVKSFNHQLGITEYKPIKEWFNHGPSDDWYELETDTGVKITITGEDSVWLPEKNCYRKVRDLDVGDVFITE